MSSPVAADVVAFLRADLAAAGEPVTQVETHISCVLMAGDRVLKLKKPVTLPFVDFAPLAAREKACRQEIVLNRRTAPALYRGLWAVVVEAEGLRLVPEAELAATAEVCDWVIEMARFADGALLSDVAQRDGLSRPLLTALAESIARFHQQAAPVAAPAGSGAQSIQDVLDGNLFCLRRFPLFAAEEVDEVGRLTAEAIARLTPLLNQRHAEGLVRQCHGDLHLGNICLLEEAPVLFDCIEFNDAFAQIDVLYDLAFLLMDLQANGWQAAASQCLNSYLEITGDEAGVALLPLFLSCRAQIRAHVSAAIAESVADPQPLLARAQDYLRLARQFLTAPAARLLAFGGLSGSGKSRAAREAAVTLDPRGTTVVLRSDVLRKRLCGVAPTAPLAAEGYTPERSQETYELLYRLAGEILAAGQSVILDAVFAREGERLRAEQAAQAAGVPFVGLWLVADRAVAEERILTRQNNASDATPEVLQAQHDYDVGEMTWACVESSGPREQTDRLVQEQLAAVLA